MVCELIAQKYILKANLPLLHLRGRDVDTIGLTATTHGKVDIEGREVVARVSLWDDVESCRVIEDVVVEGEVTTDKIINALARLSEWRS